MSVSAGLAELAPDRSAGRTAAAASRSRRVPQDCVPVMPTWTSTSSPTAALRLRRRRVFDAHRRAGLEFVGAARGHEVTGAQIAKHLHEGSGRKTRPHIHPFGLAVAN